MDNNFNFVLCRSCTLLPGLSAAQSGKHITHSQAHRPQHELPKSGICVGTHTHTHLCQCVTAHSSRHSADRQFVNNSKWLLIFETEQQGGWKSHQIDSFHPPSYFLLPQLMERRSWVRNGEKEKSVSDTLGKRRRKVRGRVWWSECVIEESEDG